MKKKRLWLIVIAVPEIIGCGAVGFYRYARDAVSNLKDEWKGEL
jgi:hypothetical protein